MENSKKDKTKKILGIVGNVLIWIFVAFSVLVTVLTFIGQNNKHGVSSIFGYGMVTIESPSMEPTYKVGDLVFVEMLDIEKAKDKEILNSLDKGDIVTFRVPQDIDQYVKKGDLLTHRVVSNEDGIIKTQGDNKETNPVEDNFYITYNDIVGVCTETRKIGGLGNVVKFLREPMGFLLIIVIPMVLFFGYEFYNFIKIVIIEKQKNKPQKVSKETEEEIKQRAIEEYLANLNKEQVSNNVVEVKDNSEEESSEEK